MRSFAHVLIGTAFLGIGLPNLLPACSAPPPPDVARALQSASAVFLAKVISVSHLPASGDTTGRYVTELATFSVLETWKGSNRPGDTIVMRSELGPGPCGMSATNNPPWLESPGHAQVVLSGVWLIYAYGSAPYELSMTTRSAPIEFGGVADLAELYRLTSARSLSVESGHRGT